MHFNFLDFLMGMFAANAIPHLIFGTMGIRFFSPFGYDARGNLIYSFVNVVVASGLFLTRYEAHSVLVQPVLLGVLYLYFAFLIVGKALYKRWNKRSRS